MSMENDGNEGHGQITLDGYTPCPREPNMRAMAKVRFWKDL